MKEKYRLHPLQRDVKALDRQVRDKYGGLVVKWTKSYMSRHLHLPEGVTTRFSYKRCNCVKCEWQLGRYPLYPSDLIRSYQRRHRDQVTVPIPPPASCVGDRDLLDPLMQCVCPRCEESRNCTNHGYTGVIALGEPSRAGLAHLLSKGLPKSLDLLCNVGTEHTPRHLRFMAPYNNRLYEMLKLPKPPQKWLKFGVIKKDCIDEADSEDETDSEDEEELFWVTDDSENDSVPSEDASYESDECDAVLSEDEAGECDDDDDDEGHRLDSEKEKNSDGMQGVGLNGSATDDQEVVKGEGGVGDLGVRSEDAGDIVEVKDAVKGLSNGEQEGAVKKEAQSEEINVVGAVRKGEGGIVDGMSNERHEGKQVEEEKRAKEVRNGGEGNVGTVEVSIEEERGDGNVEAVEDGEVVDVESVVEKVGTKSVKMSVRGDAEGGNSEGQKEGKETAEIVEEVVDQGVILKKSESDGGEVVPKITQVRGDNDAKEVKGLVENREEKKDGLNENEVQNWAVNDTSKAGSLLRKRFIRQGRRDAKRLKLEKNVVLFVQEDF